MLSSNQQQQKTTKLSSIEMKQILIPDEVEKYMTFGWSISLSRNQIAIGAANQNSNPQIKKAFIFENENNIWKQKSKLIISDGTSLDDFGFSISISNNISVVGCPGANVGGNQEQGKAYVFKNNGTFWNLNSELIASDGAFDDFFGSSVSNSETFIAIGTPYSEINGNTQQGSVYIFQANENDTFWNQSQKLIANDGQENDNFGLSTSISKNSQFLVIGAPYASIGNNTNQGKAYIFNYNGTYWNQSQILISSDGQFFDLFGSSSFISNDSNLILISSPSATIGDHYSQGKVYIFQNNGTFWNQYQILTANDGEANDRFGTSLAISNDSSLIIIGSPYAKVGENEKQGKAYIFQNNGTFWNQIQILIARDGEYQDEFGFSVLIIGNITLIGAPSARVNGLVEAGKIYVFDLNANIKSTSASSAKTTIIVLSTVIPVVFIIGIILMIFFIKKKKKKNRNYSQV